MVTESHRRVWLHRLMLSTWIRDQNLRQACPSPSRPPLPFLVALQRAQQKALLLPTGKQGQLEAPVGPKKADVSVKLL